MSGVAGAQLAALARARLAGRSFVAVSIGPGQLAGVTELGGELAGVIAVVPAGSPDLAKETGDVLWLAGASRDIFTHVVDEFAATLARERSAVARFLARVDPGAQATVISYLPVPRDIFGARPMWGQDSALCRVLEDKGSAALASVLPTPRWLPLRWPCDPGQWAGLQERLGTRTLVVQALGLSGGGTGTRICEDFVAATRSVPTLGSGPLRAAAFVAGEPCNVMGLVTGDGEVLALPCSRQLVAGDASGGPVYAGNCFEAGDFTADERAAVAGEVRQCGQMLARAGFDGPFGLDFLRVDAGTRVYHDLNPRMNGAAALLAEIIDGASFALPAVLLSRPRLGGLRSLESAIAAAVARCPRWRWFIADTLAGARTIEVVPPAGRWQIAAAGPVARWCGSDGGLDDEHAVLGVTLTAGVRVAAGERVVLGDLSCTPALGRALMTAHGERAGARLLAAMFVATCPKGQAWP